MIVWINGAFGAGKSTTASVLTEQVPTLRLFDPEHVGYMLSANLGGVDFADFQDLAAWRTLVPAVARHIAELTQQQLLAVQTVLVEEYWCELLAGLRAHDFDVFHVVLDVDDAALETRIRGDEHERQAEGWRLDHAVTYRAQREWMVSAADLVVDTTSMSASQAAAAIGAALPVD